jgi:galactose mutarotase-like enzyme
MDYIIKNEYLTVAIQKKGAMLWSIKDNSNHEYLWQGIAPFWGERAPNLFPCISGMTDGKYIYNEEIYELDFHGFAKDMDFEAEQISDTHIVFSILNTEKTYKQYPFQFKFSIIYRLEGTKIIVTYHVRNNDDKEMYFAVGGHPGFNAPLDEEGAFEEWYLEFDTVKNVKRVQISEECLVTGELAEFSLVKGVKLSLYHELFDNGAIILTDISNSVTLKSDNSKMAVRISYPDMSYLGIWHQIKKDAPYVCIEPWSSLPARDGIVEDLKTQPSLISLKPKCNYENQWSIEIINEFKK